MPTRKVFGLDGVLSELAQLQAAMARVTIPDGQEPDGAVAALVEAAEIARDALSLVWLESDRGRVLNAALARFEVAGDGEETT